MMPEPHRFCLTTRPDLIAQFVTADLLIALAYVIIPSLIAWRLRRTGVVGLFGSPAVLVALALFVAFCAMTHVMAAVTMFWPIYDLAVNVSLACAAVSLFAAGLIAWDKRAFSPPSDPTPNGLTVLADALDGFVDRMDHLHRETRREIVQAIRDTLTKRLGPPTPRRRSTPKGR
jgi:hypothetical protein